MCFTSAVFKEEILNNIAAQYSVTQGRYFNEIKVTNNFRIRI